MAKEFIIQLRISGEGRSELFLVPAGTTTIGRQEGNSIRLESGLISRQHAQLECTPTGCQITDLGSANGTLLNGERLTPNVPVNLAHGAVIEIGPFRLTYEQIPVATSVPESTPEPEPKPAPKPAPEAKAEAKEKPARPAPTAGGDEPPLPPPPPSMVMAQSQPPLDYSQPPPGLDYYSRHLLDYLPGIYHSEFMSRFLAIFEAIMKPIEWHIDNFDLNLSPRTAPPGFLPWLAHWFEISFNATWSEAQQRTLLAEAHELYARRGTAWAMRRILEIYTGVEPEIIDTAEGQEPYTFIVKLPLTAAQVNRTLLEQIIDASKPAHTNYSLELKNNGRRR
jgi:phage tail-like protein